jgi:S1-C subfamily serine protease
VVTATAGGPAASAGIVAGDIITSLNKVAVTTMAQLSAELATLKPGEQVPVGITDSAGKASTVTVTLGTLAVS